MHIAIKNKSEMKYIKSEDLKVGDVSLLELYSLVSGQQKIINDLLERIKDSYIVKKDTEYIIKLQDKLMKIDKLEIVAVEKLEYPLFMYELEDGVLKLDKKKVVAL